MTERGARRALTRPLLDSSGILSRMETAELIWQNGEFVPWHEARPTCSATGCTTARASSRGSAATRPSAARRSSATTTTSTGSPSRPSSTTSSCRSPSEEIAEATRELIRRNGLPLLLHPAARLPRLRRSGPLRDRRADRRDDRRLALGRLPGRGGTEGRHPRQGLELAPDRPGRADPPRQGVRPVPELDPRQDRVAKRRLRRGDPARRARLRLRGLGREHLHRPRGRRSSPRRTSPRSSTGSTASR